VYIYAQYRTQPFCCPLRITPYERSHAPGMATVHYFDMRNSEK